MMPCSRLLALSLSLILAACGDAATRDATARLAAGDYETLVFDTQEGSFTAILYPEAAPETVARYREYAETDYFVGRGFGRVVPGFVIQLTDRVLGVTEDTRTLPLEVSAPHHFSAGALGIARASDPNSGGPEFFVMDYPTGHLNDDFTVFGQVIEGMDVIRRIARVPAIDWGETTGLDPLLFDRIAIEPIEITANSIGSVALGAATAARYPLKTAARFRSDCCAHNLEWPATIDIGVPTDFSWYITVFEGEVELPAADDVTILTPRGEELSVTAHTELPGVYHFDWSPTGGGRQALDFVVNGETLASLDVVILR